MEFTLRKWQESDAESVYKYADNKKISDNLRDVFPHPYTFADAEFYVKDCAHNSEEAQLCRAIIIGGEAVGSVGVFVQNDVKRKSAELGYWLGEPFWGKGVMSAAVRQICAEAFERFDIVRIYAEPFAYNAASRKVLQKSGFTLEGVMKNSVFKNGEIFDSCMYALLKE